VNDTADAIVTESAAAAGQIATGQRMTAGTLSMAADGKTPVRTIMEMAKERKLATGLVTTSGITDATPGAFAAHVAHRSDEESVAEQELTCGVDVLMGGRMQFFLPESAGGKRKDGRNLLEEAQKAGYMVAGTAEGLKKIPAGKILGLFSMGNMSYEIDRSATAEPSLAEMAEKTLQILSKSKKGFFAMIEGGRIDHAAHRNDAPAVIRDTLAFDAAVGVAMDFVKKNPATLLIVTADHETAGMSLVGHGKQSKDYIGMDLKAIEKAKVSFELMAGKLGKKPTPDKVKEIVKQSMDIDLTDDEARTVADDTIKKLDPYNYSYDYLHSLAFVLRPYLRVGWGSQTHTASPLFLFGEGPGSCKIRGLMHNTEIFTVMKVALGLE
jgi:alkaline phosphatase